MSPIKQKMKAHNVFSTLLIDTLRPLSSCGRALIVEMTSLKSLAYGPKVRGKILHRLSRSLRVRLPGIRYTPIRDRYIFLYKPKLSIKHCNSKETKSAGRFSKYTRPISLNSSLARGRCERMIGRISFFLEFATRRIL